MARLRATAAMMVINILFTFKNGLSPLPLPKRERSG